MFTEQRVQRTSNNPSRSLCLVNRDAVKDIKVPGFEHQTTPFIERSLMTSKPSTFRIIPGVDDNGNILSTLKEGYNRELLDKDPASCLSGTFCSVSAIQPFGNQWRDAVLTAYPPGSADEEERIEQGMMSVLEKFSRVVNFCTDTQKRGRRPIQAHQDWFRWTALKGCLGKVKWRFMFQAILFQDSGRYFINRNEATGQDEYRNMIGVVSLDQQASIQEFMEGLAVPAIKAHPVDVFTNSNLGPVAELNGIWCYVHPEEAYGETNIKSKLVPHPYAVGASMDTPPTPYPLEASWVKSVWQPWKKLLKWYTKEEQFYLISEVFGPDTVNYFFEALGDDRYTAFIPMDIRQKGYGRYNGMLTRSINLGTPYPSNPNPDVTSTVIPPAAPSMMNTPTAPTPVPMPAVPMMETSTEAAAPAPSPAMPAMTPPIPTMSAPAPAPAVPPMDKIGHMPEAAPSPSPALPPAVQEMMKQALEQGVQVQGSPSVIQSLGLPKVPTIDLGDIVPSEED